MSNFTEKKPIHTYKHPQTKTMDEYLGGFGADDLLTEGELAKLPFEKQLLYNLNRSWIEKSDIAQPEKKELGEITIYKSEKSLAREIQNARSIALYAQAKKWALGKIDREKVLCSLNEDRSAASIDDADLYYVESILVSTNWNKNDDVFKNDEVFFARKSPISKPSNLNHEEHKIVGHLTKTWLIDNDGKLIADTTPPKSLPDFFHLACGSVIYLAYSTDEMISQTSTLIDQIEEGTKYVSMECLFSDFDYAVGNNNGYEIIERNDESAWLTSKLRAYGGNGEYKGRKVGRLLKGINFVGKGYVDKPANPESVIL